MATVVKDFKVKNGLIVEGSTATVNNHDILTKKQDDQDYIVGLIGGTATSANTADTVVKRDANGDFAAGTITADLTGQVSDISNHDTADLAEGTNLYFTNQRALDATSAAYDAAGAAAAAESAANGYTDTREGLITTAYQSYADTAEQDAKDYADDLINDASNLSTEVWSAYKTATEISVAQTAANAYTDAEVAALVGSAPELLDTLNELAAAIGDDENFAANLATSVGERVAKAGDTMTGLLVLSADPSANLGAATKQYVDAAQSAAEDYADGLAVNYDAAGSASTAQTNAESFATNAINALDTDDIEEGAANQYFTDARAKSSAADLLTGASLTNITITGSGSGLTITAENGVADSDTDDLVEGTTNLYFTDVRAVDALEAVTPDFPAVEIASVAKQVAAEATVATASTSTAVLWAKADYRAAEFLVKIANGSHTEVSKVILTLDTSDNVAVTEYAMVGTNGSLGSVSADVSGTDVRLRVVTINNDSTVTVVGTLLK